MTFSMLRRTRWRPKQCLSFFLLSLILIHDMKFVNGAPQPQFGSEVRASSGPQRKQNSRFQPHNPIRVVPDIDDEDLDDDFDDLLFSRGGSLSSRFASRARSSGSISRTSGGRPIPSDSSSTFGIPLSATNDGVELPGRPLPSNPSASFGVPLGAANVGGAQPGRSVPSDSSFSFGIPLSSSGLGSTAQGGKLSFGSQASFGIPLSATNIGGAVSSGASASVRVPLSATNTGGAIPSHQSTSFGVPLSATSSGGVLSSDSASSVGVSLSATNIGGALPADPSPSFGIPLSATNVGGALPAGALPSDPSASFGIPLSATNVVGKQPGSSLPSDPSSSFGVSLSSKNVGGAVQGGALPSDSSASFGVPLSATNVGGVAPSSAAVAPQFTVTRTSLEDGDDIVDDDVSFDLEAKVRSHFTAPSHPSRSQPQTQRGRGGIGIRIIDELFDDSISIENFDKSNEILSLGRRFHPQGIPRRSDVTLTNVEPPKSKVVISNPFIFAPVDTDDSIDDLVDDVDDDDDIDEFVVLSPMIKAYNAKKHDERLSLSNDFLSQYNFVDVQGTKHWGYKTGDQFQKHQLDESGRMEGNFGWTSPGGSEVKIRYIADNDGYRVVSSTGLYTRDSDEVLRLKEKHFQEHAKVKQNFKSIKDERKKPFRTSQPHAPVLKPDIDDLDDVDLPTFSAEDVTQEVGVFFDTSLSSATPTKEPAGFGIPLPDPAITLKSEKPLVTSEKRVKFTPAKPSIFLESDETLVHSVDSSIGIPLPDQFTPITSEKVPAYPSDQAVVTPFLDSTPLKTDLHLTASSVPGAGVPLPDPFLSLTSDKAPAPPSDQAAGTPFLDSTPLKTDLPVAVSPVPGAGVPLPDPFSPIISDKAPALPSEQGFGIPFLDSTSVETDLPLAVSPVQGVGVPLPGPSIPDLVLTLKTEVPSVPQDFSGVPLPDPGVQLISKSPVDHAFGSPFPDSSIPSAIDTAQTLPSGQGVGVALPDSSLTVSPGQEIAVVIPEADIVVDSSKELGVAISDPTSTQTIGVPLSETDISTGDEISSLSEQGIRTPYTETFAPHIPSSPSVFGIPLGSQDVTPVTKEGFPSSGLDFGLPLVDDSKVEQPTFKPMATIIKSDTKIDTGVPLSVSVPTDVTLSPSVESIDISITDSSEKISPSSGLGFGIELSGPGAPVSETGFGIPPIPAITHEIDSVLPPSSQDFGVPLTDSTPVHGPESALPPTTQDFAIPLSQLEPVLVSDNLLPPPPRFDSGIPLSQPAPAPSVDFVDHLSPPPLPPRSDFGIPLAQPTPTADTDGHFGIHLLSPPPPPKTDVGIHLSHPAPSPAADFDSHLLSPPPSVRPDFGIQLSQPALAPTPDTADELLPRPSPPRADIGIPLSQPAPAPAVDYDDHFFLSQPPTPPRDDFGFSLSQPAPAPAKAPTSDTDGHLVPPPPRADLGIPLSKPIPAPTFDTDRHLFSPPPPRFDSGIPLSQPVEAEVDLATQKQEFDISLSNPTKIVSPQRDIPSQFDQTLTVEASPVADHGLVGSPIPTVGVSLDLEDTLLLPVKVPVGSFDSSVADVGVEIPVIVEPVREGTYVAQDISNQENLISGGKRKDIQLTSFKTETPATIVERPIPPIRPTFESFGIPLEVDHHTPAHPQDSTGSSGSRFFVSSDNDDHRSFIQPARTPPQGGQKFDHREVDIPESPVSSFILNTIQAQNEAVGVRQFDDFNSNQFLNTGIDLLQGPPVVDASTSLINVQEPRANPCLNRKIHPALLPAECHDRPISEPRQSIGKSLSSTTSNQEAKKDSFIVVVDSDIFQ